MEPVRRPTYGAPAPGDPRPPPPPPTHYPQSQPPPPPGHHPGPHPSQQQPPYAAHAGPPGAGPGPPQGQTLPPIQHNYPPPGPPPEQPAYLPPFRQAYDQREQPEYHQYNQHNRSGHATPAPVRSYSESHNRTPTTPAQNQYPPISAPDNAQPPPHMEHGGHPGYPPTNGVAHHGLPAPGPPPPGPMAHHDPHGQYAMTPVEQHHQYGPPPGHMYAQPAYGAPTLSNYSVQRKKQMRATQACEQCRQRKQKCDEGAPCSFCKESNLNCQYRDTPPAKTDKNMEKVIQYLEQNAQNVSELKSDLISRISDFDTRLRRMEEQQRVNAVAGAEPEVVYPELEDPAPIKKGVDDHRTAPHKLILLWPSVGPLFSESRIDINDGYVMQAEDRGLPRLYGRGEGIDEEDGTQPGGTASPARSEESSPEYTAPTPPEGLWGYGFSAALPGLDPNRSHPLGAGGLKPDGSLDLDSGTISSLYESYLKHMHPLHPFLDEKRTRKVIEKFIARYSPQRLRPHFAVGGNEADRPLKRQRSNGNGPGLNADVPVNRIVHTERSPRNAIVYLVLALGKICAHGDPLPGLVQDRASVPANQHLAHEATGTLGFANSSPMSMNIKPSPSSPKLTPTTHPTPPSLDNGMRFDSRSRRSSFDGGASPVTGPRNMDVIPGLAYYAKAAEILGDQADGNDLVHAQMFLLAGLYKGQLARVKESMSWITMAGRVVQLLLDRYKLYNLNYWGAFGDVRRNHEMGQKTIKDKRQSMIVLAAWTCLQLESDILAELRLPSSGIQNIENLLLMPHNVKDDEDLQTWDELQAQTDDMVLFIYTAQMFLRKRLNQVHREMYGPDCRELPLTAVQQILIGHENLLEEWRRGLPAYLRWEDTDSPPSDILSARLRAKYYGARYVIHRIYLDFALHILPHIKEGRSVEEVAIDVHGHSRDLAEVHLFKAIQGMGEEAVWSAARRCIAAAMQSTVAFDGVKGRLIVTNPHGTNHAQFGNMLVLAATYNNPALRQLVDTDKFQRLLERTISSLRRLSPISPTCHNDCLILEKINRHLFGAPSEVYHNEREPASAANSFSA